MTLPSKLKATTLALLTLVAIAHLVNKNPTSTRELAKTTVMITRMDGKSGGTGVILSSAGNTSQILTNAHVCGVVKNGGLVITDGREGTVTSYRVSNVHDLCLITTNVNFHVNTRVSNTAPDVYSDAIVSGHPRLLPTIVTRGSFSQKEIVSVMTGFRACTPEDLNNPDLSTYCVFFGGIPLIRTYQAQVVSATIQAGSSGSAVFNSKGEIAGLVFAGSGDIGYGMIVPQEYVSFFVNSEAKTLEEQLPNTFVSLAPSQGGESTNTARETCENAVAITDEAIKHICSLIKKDLVF